MLDEAPETGSESVPAVAPEAATESLLAEAPEAGTESLLDKKSTFPCTPISKDKGVTVFFFFKRVK